MSAIDNFLEIYFIRLDKRASDSFFDLADLCSRTFSNTIFSSIPICPASCMTYKDRATLSFIVARGRCSSAITLIFPSVVSPCLSMACSIKNVIIPEYGHPLDEIARQVWESLGFHVRQFIMNDMARKGGAIRCSSQRVPSTVHYEEEVVGASLH